MLAFRIWALYICVILNVDITYSKKCWDGKAVFGGEEKDRKLTADNLNCLNWKKRAEEKSRHSNTYKKVDGSSCKILPPHGKFGPWCFLEVGGLNSHGYEPCYAPCQDVAQSNRKRCYWKADAKFRKRVSNLYFGDKQNSPDGLCASWDKALDGKDIRGIRPTHSYCRTYSDPFTGAPKKYPWCFALLTNGLKPAYCFPFCDDVEEDKCLSLDKMNRLIYEGKLNTALDAKACVDWSGRDGGPVGNKECRNPTEHPGVPPYCFVSTTVDIRVPCFEICKRPKEECVGAEKLLHYRGSKRVTLSGRKCADWWLKDYLEGAPLNVDESWMAFNFCRNPDGDTIGPWCFVEGEEKVKEACFPQCHEHGEDGWEHALAMGAEVETPEVWEEEAKKFKTEKPADFQLPPFTEIIRTVGIILLVLFTLSITWNVINLFLYEWEKRCLGYRDLLTEMKEMLEGSPPSMDDEEEWEAYLKLWQTYKQVRNVAKHSWSGGNVRGWEEFDRVTPKQR